ncbi:glucosamine inositolphosphorylceramide transferase family protein [Bordetella genomosp. 11]|uniref:Glucosamine inositolphosphorylceramide transferase 1 N-terminal domain-containing protein n=1 Tax=Bordetella genomosp. 11 TaxID=1416808 RepID=A0A261UCD9_9BORD|nr:hypothetical protein [Bordetella genomosp. 11]OZI59589.1 hypothetical protein CAL28_08680 [Bordetella genomosp. 11]
MDKKTVALLVNATNQPGWVHDVAQWLSREEHFQIAALIVAWDDTQSAERSLPWSRDPLGTVARLESRMLETRHRAQLATSELTASLPPGTPVLDLGVTRGHGGLLAADPEQLRDLIALRLDVILILGAPAIRGELASLPTHGVWMPVHSDLKDQQHVAHAGFWEVYQRADHTTVKLWRLGATEQADELLDARSFNTEVFWLKNRARALSLANLMIFDTLQAMAQPERRKQPSSSLQIHTAMTRPQPAQWDGAAYLARQAWLASSMVLRRAMKRNVRWRIGMCPTGRQEVVTSEAAVMVPPKGRFFADPFVYTRNGQPYIFFEDYYFRERKGKISVATYIDGAFRFLGVVLDLPYHLSFPYIFEYGGATYMVPETCGNRTIELWKCTEFPLKWELHCRLMDNISAVDTIVFPYGGHWWLFTNIDRTDGVSHCDELFAFYADRPDTDRWTPHALNPIVHSPVKARNAGVILAPDGSVVRCAQSQGFQHYGNGVSLNRIEELTPHTYREADGPVNYPSFLRKPYASMHHWHHHGGHTVFDFAFME